MDDEEYQVSSELYQENSYISDLKPTYNPKNVVSKFKYIPPAKNDADGDLLVSRKTNNEPAKKFIEIEHSTSTVLNLVGLQIWRGALLLADWLLYNQKNIPENCTILELGSGVGLTSIIAAISHDVVCTDIDKGGLLDLIRHNVIRNHETIMQDRTKAIKKLDEVIRVLELDFLAPFSPEIEAILPQVGIILAADVIYDDFLTEAFVKTVQTLIDKAESLQKKIDIYVALEKRYVFTVADCDTCAPCYEYFLERLQKLKRVKTVNCTLDFPQYFEYDRVKELVLWKISSM